MRLIEPSMKPGRIALISYACAALIGAASGSALSLHTTYLPHDSTTSTLSTGTEVLVITVATWIVPLPLTCLVVLRLASVRDSLALAAISGALTILLLFEVPDAILLPTGRPHHLSRLIWEIPLISVLVAGLWSAAAAGWFGLLWITRCRVIPRATYQCRPCGYDLSGLTAEAPCPECRSMRRGTARSHAIAHVPASYLAWGIASWAALFAMTIALRVVKSSM